MSKYRFSGTIKEIQFVPLDMEFGVAPDREYAIAERTGKSEVLFVALLPEDDHEGIVFKYVDNVRVVAKDKAKLVTWTINGHYSLVLESVTDEKDCDIEIKDAPTSKYFKLESVTEKS